MRPAPLVLCSLALLLPLGQKNAAAQEPRQLPPIVVSASGLPLTEAAVNQHVQVFTRDQLDAHPPGSAAEFLARHAGVMVDRRGRSGGYGSLFLRGADPSHVVVLIDGVRQNDPLSSRGSAVDLNSLSIDDVERIEVVRGNTSVVHGEALAGVVQLFTRTPSTGTGRLMAEAGDEGLGAAAASFASPSWRLSASHRQDGQGEAGRVRNASFNGGFEHRRANTLVRVAARVAAGSRRSFPDDSGGPRLAVNRELEDNDSDTRQLSVFLQQDLAASGILEARVSGLGRDSLQETPQVVPGVRDPLGLPRIRSDGMYERSEAQLNWLGTAAGWDVLLGLQSQHERGSLGSTIFLGAPVPASFRISRSTHALVAEGRRNSGAWSYHLGLRSEYTPGHGSAQHPALGVQYRLPEDAGRFGMALSSAAKLPSFYALGHPLVGNPALRREATRQQEVYYAREWARGSSARVTMFRARFRDLVDFDAGPPPRLVNRARIRSEGVEFDSRIAWSSRVAYRVQATLMNVGNAEGGEPLRHRPHRQLALGLQSEFAPGWVAAADLLHVGRRWDSAIPTGGRWLAAYSELQLSLSRRTRAWELYGALDNALGSRAEEVIGTPVGERRLRLGMRFFL